jgi:hypothetical protein
VTERAIVERGRGRKKERKRKRMHKREMHESMTYEREGTREAGEGT